MPKIKAQKINNIEEAKYGDFIFFRPTYSLFSILIPFFDGSPFSHVGMYLGHKYGQNLFIEAQDGVGVVITPLKEWRNYEIVRTELSTMPISKVFEDLGKPYDRLKIFAFLLNKIFSTPLLADDDHALVCSESCNKWKYYKHVEKGQATVATLYNSCEFV